jgi:hypothetical protein
MPASWSEPGLMGHRRDVFDDKYARLRPDRPCKTIVAHLAKDGTATFTRHRFGR